jgi:heptosyltransferase I
MALLLSPFTALRRALLIVCMNILLVKLSSLGDVIQTLPVLHDLEAWWRGLQATEPAQRTQALHIDWVVEESFAPLVAKAVGVRRVIPVALRRWRRGLGLAKTRAEWRAFRSDLQSTRYDAVVDCQGLTKSALVARLALLAAGGVRGSFANRSEACGYEWPVKFLLPHNQAMPQRIHAVARTRLLAAKLLGYSVQGVAQVAFRNLPQIDRPARDQVFLAHGTTRVDNEWALERWAALAQRLVADGCCLVLAHSNAREQQFCEALAQQHPAATQTLPRMGLAEVLDAMSLCQGVIGVDSGLSHLAVALGLPHVQIFSQDRAWRAGPVGVAHQLALGGRHTPGVDEVWQAWCQVRASKNAAAGGA